MLLLVISTLTSHLNQPANRSRNNSQHFKNVDSSQQPPHRSSAPQARPPAHHLQHLHPAGVQEHWREAHPRHHVLAQVRVRGARGHGCQDQPEGRRVLARLRALQFLERAQRLGDAGSGEA